METSEIEIPMSACGLLVMTALGVRILSPWIPALQKNAPAFSAFRPSMAVARE